VMLHSRSLSDRLSQSRDNLYHFGVALECDRASRQITHVPLSATHRIRPAFVGALKNDLPALIAAAPAVATRRSIRVSLAIDRSVFSSVSLGARLRTTTGHHIANPNERRRL